MPSSILNSDDGVISGTSGLKSSGGDDGVLNIQNNGTTAVTVDASGNVGIGTSSPSANLNVYNATSAIISVDGDNATQFRAARYSTDTGAASFALRKARGTLASPSAVASADSVGFVNFTAYGGANFRSVAQIQGTVETYTSDTNIAGALIFSTNSSSTTSTEKMRIDSSGNLLFNSGYGSVATAYGCRAWVSFNGTGTPAIRASGNVSSITDVNTGNYTVNFATAMPDANYSATANGVKGGGGASQGNSLGIFYREDRVLAGSIEIFTMSFSGTAQDPTYVMLSVNR